MTHQKKTDSMPDPLVICCAINGAYALPLTVMLRSALSHLSGKQSVDVYVVDDGILPSDKGKVLNSLPDEVHVYWLRPQRSDFSGLPIWGRMPLVTYDRLMIARLLPASISKAIWLDADLLVFGDISELWNLDVSGSHVLAVRDWLIPQLGSRFGVAGCKKLGLDPEAGYFNAGVMVINLELWRRDDIAARALAYLKRYRDRVFFLDQEGLNAVLAGKWRQIDRLWNWSLFAERQELSYQNRKGITIDNNSRQDPHILHFTGNLKPWNYNGSTVYDEIYYQYLDMTVWANWRPSRGWKRTLLHKYASSNFRQLYYGPEQWLMYLQRRFSRRYISVDEKAGVQ